MGVVSWRATMPSRMQNLPPWLVARGAMAGACCMGVGSWSATMPSRMHAFPPWLVASGGTAGATLALVVCAPCLAVGSQSLGSATPWAVDMPCRLGRMPRIMPSRSHALACGLFACHRALPTWLIAGNATPWAVCMPPCLGVGMPCHRALLRAVPWHGQWACHRPQPYSLASHGLATISIHSQPSLGYGTPP